MIIDKQNKKDATKLREDIKEKMRVYLREGNERTAGGGKRYLNVVNEGDHDGEAIKHMGLHQ